MVNTITVPRCITCNTRNPYYEAIRPGEAAVEDQLIGGPTSYLPETSTSTADWECTRCHARNPNISMTCNTCRTSRLLSLPLNTRQPPRSTAGNGAAVQGTIVGGSQALGSTSGNRWSFNNPFRGKNPWQCETCHKVQQRDLIRCRRCGAINGQAIVERAQEQQAALGDGGYGGGK
jgi:ribosomal protein L40E